MYVEDARKKARQEMKDMPMGKKLEYIFGYYKWYILIAVFLVVFVVSYVNGYISNKDPVLSGFILNSKYHDTFSRENEVIQKLTEDFLSTQEAVPEGEAIYIDYSMQYNPDDYLAMSNQAVINQIAANASAGSLDFVFGDTPSVMKLAYMEMFRDLRQVFTEEELERMAEYVLYIDMDVVKQREAALGEGGSVEDVSLPDPLDPKGMMEPVPVLIQLEPVDTVKQLYMDDVENYAVGFNGNGDNDHLTVAFIKYISENLS